MASNRVGISSFNIPVLSAYEPFLHTASEVSLSVEWGNGFPGNGGLIEAEGQLHLTPYRFIFVPKHPTASFFSYVLPLQLLDDVTSNLPFCYNLEETNRDLYRDVPLDFADERGFYDMKKFNRKYILTGVLRPLRNDWVSELDYASQFLGYGSLPRNNFSINGVVTSPARVQITFPGHASCTVHRVPANLSGTPISCSHPDFFASFVRAYNLARQAGKLPLYKFAKESAHNNSNEIEMDSVVFAPGSPLLLPYVISTHTMQDFSIFEQVCMRVGLHPRDVYSETPMQPTRAPPSSQNTMSLQPESFDYSLEPDLPPTFEQ